MLRFLTLTANASRKRSRQSDLYRKDSAQVMNLKQLFWAFRFPILVFIINEIALDPVYVRFPWFDLVMHVLGGVVIALSTVELLSILHKEKKFHATPFVNLIVVVSFVALIAVAWEWHEYLRMLLLNAPPNTLEDTLSDLALGVGGGAVTALWRRVR